MKGMRALGLMALSSLACRFSDIFVSSDPLSNVARGGVGTAMLMTEMFGTKMIGDALHRDTAGKAVAKLLFAAAVPLIGAAVSYEYPIASYVLFYLPVFSFFAFNTRRD